VYLAASDYQQLRVSLQAIVTEERHQRRDEGRLPVGAGAVQQEKNLLPDVTGQRVPDRSPQEADQIGASNHLLEKLFELGAARVLLKCDRRKLCDQVGRVMRVQLAGTEINRPVHDVELPGIAVEVVRADGDPFVEAREGDHGIDPTQALAVDAVAHDLRPR